MLGTTLNYVALRLLGEGPEGGGDGAVTKARKWVLDHEGATLIPAWGKVYLSVLGTYEWSGCNPVPPEFLLFPSFLPFSPDDYLVNEDKTSLSLVIVWCHLRTVYTPMSYLYGKKLRGEPYIQPYEEIDWNEARHLCLKEDLYTSRSIAQNLLLDGVHYLSERLLKQWPFSKLREQALQEAIKHIHYEDESTRYMINASIEKALLLLSQMPAEIVGETIDTERLHNAIDFLLSLQRKNGGFSVWEPARGQRWLEVLNPTQAFGDVMVETEYVECTASAIQVLTSRIPKQRNTSFCGQRIKLCRRCTDERWFLVDLSEFHYNASTVFMPLLHLVSLM
ncbi:hypothetical protein POTOM_015758 [Populus tomentosa]|uniref:Squalene cyclase N-terminal domain-containing protein n=1 Tax=Populus tomentosa TaxID=118781 RepID=A0A8X7ZYB5_POPTO|nr:hypothetical protein POTOM_015758 [Populus tomentosa]